MSGAADYQRFKKNEASPAFAAASNSVAFASQEGQRNLSLDWSSSLHDFDAGTAADDIVDAPDAFAMSFKALGADATTQVKLRNLQQFRPAPGAMVGWTNRASTTGTGQVLQGGSVPVDSKGLITLTLQVLSGGNRLTLSGSSSPAPPTVTLSASPASIASGQSATLTWSSTNATSVAIN